MKEAIEDRYREEGEQDSSWPSGRRIEKANKR